MNPLAPSFDDHRAHLAALRAAALAAADPAQAVRRWLLPADLAGVERVYLVALGKAGVGMILAAAQVAGPRLAAGVAAVPHLPDAAGATLPERVTFIEGGHPEPNAGSLTAGRAVAALLSAVTERDLVVVLISGGGSALIELPRAGISLAELKGATAALLKSGAPIQDFNRVRTQLSQLKGGGLARLARPARVLGLILSDVVDSPLAAIASGPTVLNMPDGGAALAVVERYGLKSKLPASVVWAMQHGTTPLSGDPPRVENRLIGSNRLAAEAAVVAAARLGFAAELLGDDWQGEARLMGRRVARQLLALAAAPARARAAPVCLVAGGESTVTVRGRGRGGRNQEAALAAGLALDGQAGLVMSTFATDGVDGPTDAAGATVTGDTLPRARALDLDAEHYLNDNDSYNFFAQVGGLVITGPTGTNVNDLMFGLAY
jgi:glycerate 2-kinase